MDANNIIINIRKILRSVNLESKRIEKQYGISIPQLLALNYLNSLSDCRATQKEISTHLNLNMSTVTGIISRLEKKGLIMKSTSEQDRRVHFATLTAKGLKLLQEAPALMHDQLAARLSNTSPEKLVELEKAFELVIDFMGIAHVEASPMVTSGEIESE